MMIFLNPIKIEFQEGVAGNGTSAWAGAQYSRMYGETDMETKIHQLEQEAYTSVSRAFKSQADAITWEKESLITELRKELRLSNEEHRELLGRVNADDTIRFDRGMETGRWASTWDAQYRSSFGWPSPSFHPQSMAASHHPSSSTPKRGLASMALGKRQKPGRYALVYDMGTANET